MGAVVSEGRRGTGRNGGLLAAAVALATGVAAVGVRAAAGAPLRGVGPGTDDAVWLAALFALGTFITASRYSSHARSTESNSKAEDRLRQATIVVLLISAVAVPVALFLLRPRSPGKHVAKKPEDLSPQPRQPPPDGNVSSFDLSVFVLVVLIVVGVLALGWLIAALVRTMRDAPTPAASGSLIEPAQNEDESLTTALLAGRSALTGDDPRTAIVACYAAMEASLVQAGVTRERSDSPSDLLRRATDRDLPGASARDAETLTALFREARFSSHRMTAQQLHAARSALDAVTSALLDSKAAR